MSNLNSKFCGCEKAADLNLNKEILKVFLKDLTPSKKKLVPASQVTFGRFTVFDERHMRAVHSEAERLAGLDPADLIEELSNLKTWHPDSAYVDYLARIALFKHKETRNLILPPASQTIPALFFKMGKVRGKGNLLLGAALHKRMGSIGEAVLDPEQKLDWWREDPGLAEHHYNWHVYYPYTEPEKDRQGELFAYMHQQMLARYNAERFGVGLPPVLPFGPGIGWDRALTEGYNPNLEDYSFRPAAMIIPDSATLGSRAILPSVMKTNTERLCIAIARNYLEDLSGNKVELTMDKLGCSMESNMGSVNKKLYGNVHNNGHVLLSLINDPSNTYNISPGPMIDTHTAPRDPVFFRWHKFVDSVFEALRTNMTPHKVEDLTMDGIEVETVCIESTTEPDAPNMDCHDSPNNKMYTWMRPEEYTVYSDQGEITITETRMHYESFTYNIKVKNSQEEAACLVFRIFLAPTKSDDDLETRRNDFIELDRFVEMVEGGEERIISRLSEDSAVLVPPSCTVQQIQDGQITDSKAPCGCGWPRNLLVPRGTPRGMIADLYVLVTNWNEDTASPNSQLSGSVSYCGKRDELYPDKKPMGFPFDRAMGFTTLEEMVRAVPNSCSTEVKILFKGYKE